MLLNGLFSIMELMTLSLSSRSWLVPVTDTAIAANIFTALVSVLDMVRVDWCCAMSLAPGGGAFCSSWN